MGFLDSILGYVGSAIAGAGIPVVSGIAQGIMNEKDKNDARADAIAQSNADKKWSAEQAQLNREFQREERLQTQQFNVDMWNMQNDYDSPQAQLARATAAGINPNAVFNHGIPQGNAQQVKSTPMSGSTASHPGSIASGLLLHEAQYNALTAQAELTKAQADSEKYGLSWDKLTAPVLYEQLMNMNKESKARIDKIVREVAHIDFDEQLQRDTFAWFASKTEAEIKEIGERMKLLRAQTKTENERAELVDAQTYDTLANIAVKDKQVEGYDYENIEKRTRAEIAEITGAPADTPLGNLMFMLYKESRYEDFNRVLATSMATSNNMVAVPAGLAGLGLGDLGRVIDESLFGKTVEKWKSARNTFWTK